MLTSKCRNAHPEHFFRAIEHGLALMVAGASPAMLDVMAQGMAAMGLPDASNGYMHAKLRVMGFIKNSEEEHRPSCRAVTGKVNSGFCFLCRKRRSEP